MGAPTAKRVPGKKKKTTNMELLLNINLLSSLGSRLLTVTVLERQEGGAVKRDAVLTRAIFLYNK